MDDVGKRDDLVRHLEKAIKRVRLAEDEAKRIGASEDVARLIHAHVYQLTKLLEWQSIPDQFGPSAGEVSAAGAETLVNAIGLLAAKIHPAPELSEPHAKLMNLIELLLWYGKDAVEEINAGLARHHWNAKNG